MRCGLTNLELTPDNRTQGRMNILIIPEDFRKDQYLLRPLFRQLFKRIGRSSAKVTVCSDPLLGGVREALKSERLKEIVEQYDGMVDMFILCVDRDGKAGRQQRLDGIESEFGIERSFLASNAWEELETWILAGLQLPARWKWPDVRAEVNVKERYFEALAEKLGVAGAPGGGRKPLGEEASRNISAVRYKCPEDFDTLARRIEALHSS